MLAGDLSTALTGRHRTLELFPFEYTEYQIAKPEAHLEDFLSDGGFPRALSSADSSGLLREYFRDIIERDVRGQVSARSALVLTQLAKAIYESTGSETSLRKLAKVTDLSVDTVKSYVDAFASAYLILECRYFTFSERKRLVRPSKYYPIDLGLHRSIISKGGADRGKRLETAVFHSLRRRYGDVFYWKNQGEVDFVVETSNGITPIQVSWDGPKERHHKAVAEFMVEFPFAAPAQFVSIENAAEFLSQ